MTNMKVAPLKSSFMLAAMLGFMITIIYTSYGRISETWGFALGFLFALMFIASFISMNQAPIEAQLEINKDMVTEQPPKKRNSAAKKKKK